MQKLLIVDEHREMRRLFEMALRNSERQILEAENSEEAIKLAREHKPALIILDLGPFGRSFTPRLIQLLKEQFDTKACPILAIGTTPLPSNYHETRPKADGFMAKPFKISLLRSMVDNLIAQPSPQTAPPRSSSTALTW